MEKILTEETKGTINCMNCFSPNPLQEDHCFKCGCSLWIEENEAVEEEEIACEWEAFGTSFTGLRDNNEDSFYIHSDETFHDNQIKKQLLLALADGMGGHKRGEQASKMAIETLAILQPKDSASLQSSIEVANRQIALQAWDDEVDMGTTIVSAIITGNKVEICWAGDSPLYHIKNNEIIYRTSDHSFANELIKQGLPADEAKRHPEASLVTKSLGIKGFIHPEKHTIKVMPGDFLLLCSDGLSSFIRDDELCRIIEASGNVKDASNLMLEAALNNGSDDNITLILARYGSKK